MTPLFRNLRIKRYRLWRLINIFSSPNRVLILEIEIPFSNNVITLLLESKLSLGILKLKYARKQSPESRETQIQIVRSRSVFTRIE